MGGVKVGDVVRNKLEIGNDCWIGSNVVITAKCHSIGNGAVVGAGSIVTHDVEPYSVVAGNPARKIKKRFNDNEIDMLEKSKWYELTPDILLRFYELKDNPIAFANAILEYKEKKC